MIRLLTSGKSHMGCQCYYEPFHPN